MSRQGGEALGSSCFKTNGLSQLIVGCGTSKPGDSSEVCCQVRLRRRSNPHGSPSPRHRRELVRKNGSGRDWAAAVEPSSKSRPRAARHPWRWGRGALRPRVV